MSKNIIIILLGAIAIASTIAAVFSIRKIHLDNKERKGAEVLDSFYRAINDYIHKYNLANWNYQTNITEETEAYRTKTNSDYIETEHKILSEMKEFDWKNFGNPNLKTNFERNLYFYNSDPARETYFYDIVSKMESTYSTTRICDYRNKTKCDLNLEPEIAEIFEKSRDPEELKHAWIEWHQKIGTQSKYLFKEYVKLRKELFSDGFNHTEWWLIRYKESNIEQQLKDLWLQIRPLYLQMHAYVRKQLYNKYGPGIIDRRGPIPAHLIGSMWGESWLNLVSNIRPYPNKPAIDITSVMLKKNFTALKMFQLADEFLQSMDLIGVPKKFWNNSVFTKLDDGRQMNCYPSAWNMETDDYRIKQCTVVNDKYFETVHHQMGHIQYLMQYSLQPLAYECGNPGFHEAIGDLIASSATSSKHLRKIGLLEDDHDDYESKINELFCKATSKLAVTPLTYFLDPYRFALFKGKVGPENLNCYFWKLKERYQGIEPPVRRTEENCDAVSMYQVSTDNPYNIHFMSQVIQFQFHKALCKIAGEYEEGNEKKKLSDCDIYQSAEAGNALRDVMKLGTSVHWRKALEQLTGESELNANSMLEYFEPLRIWLEKENEKTGELIGWEMSKMEFCTDEQEAELLPVLANDNMATLF